MAADVRTCEHCCSRFGRPRGRTDRAWQRRRFCSRDCAFASRRGDEPGRFWAKVDRRGPDECWRWLGVVKGGSERGRFKRDGVALYAYRVAYELAVGEIPEGHDLHHTCEHEWCVNPAHLAPITHAEHTILTHAGISHDLGAPHPKEARRGC